jgi:hypothetical protein
MGRGLWKFWCCFVLVWWISELTVSIFYYKEKRKYILWRMGKILIFRMIYYVYCHPIIHNGMEVDTVHHSKVFFSGTHGVSDLIAQVEINSCILYYIDVFRGQCIINKKSMKFCISGIWNFLIIINANISCGCTFIHIFNKMSFIKIQWE